jgi:hypothetical protein
MSYYDTQSGRQVHRLRINCGCRSIRTDGPVDINRLPHVGNKGVVRGPGRIWLVIDARV